MDRQLIPQLAELGNPIVWWTYDNGYAYAYGDDAILLRSVFPKLPYGIHHGLPYVAVRADRLT